MALARLGDIVLIAGKGHENYQELSTGRIDFSDAKEVRRNMFIKEREEFPPGITRYSIFLS